MNPSGGAPFASWPALDLRGQPLPSRLAYERGIWGKVHGAPSDFRWIATTPSFASSGRRDDLPRELHLGTEDAPEKSISWRILGDICYAMSAYPSRATDAAGRTGFLEKQVLEWRRPEDVPAALAALLLLPHVASFDDSVWWDRRTGPRWSDDEDATLSLSPTETASPLPVATADVEAAITRGLAQLTAAISEPALAELYAALLVGQSAISLRGLRSPLSAEAVAALLLPLPRPLADSLSIAGWLPSRRVPDADELQRCWDLVLGGPAAPPPPAVAPTPDQERQARAMAQGLLAGDPAPLGEATPSGHRASVRPQQPIELAMWGLTAAGKTALLAQLFIEGDGGDWEIFPTATSRNFILVMQERIRTNNGFPSATAGGVEKIEYQFRNRTTGVEVSLSMEDRAGSASEGLSDGLKDSLGRAAGLVLVFDPPSEGGALASAVSKTLIDIHIASGRGAQRDERPIAVCLSKADMLIESPQDLRRAQKEPDAFVREHDHMGLVRTLDRYFNNYRLFPVSAAGVRQRRGVVEPLVFYDEKLAPRICPVRDSSELLNVMAPFTWLLDKVTGRA